MRGFLRTITQLTPIAAGLAAGLIAVGAISIIGGSYDQSLVQQQLAPQKIYFPKPAEYADLAPYAGKQVLTGAQARLYANDQLAPDINKVAGGKTYAQVSDAWIAGGMKNTVLASQRQTLFMGETLKGLLLNAWGWAQIGSYAILAGILAVVLGSILFLLPMLNWFFNLRPARKPVATAKPAGSASPVRAGV
ncbi:MAG TPA: hypothetical protein VHM72_04690 [Solirubrobacteraceae bacterium]|jgi:hypothetical protein|nr:hypothetical protein [Solirubrobacteraceae bacterium]